MELINEHNTNYNTVDMLSNFMDDIDKYKEELSKLEKEYEVLLNEQEEGSKKISSFSDMIQYQMSA